MQIYGGKNTKTAVKKYYVRLNYGFELIHKSERFTNKCPKIGLKTK